MPRFRISATVTSDEIYEVDAPTEEEALAMIDRGEWDLVASEHASDIAIDRVEQLDASY